MDRLYYLNNGTSQTGPFTLDAIREMRPQGITHVWYAGLENWVTVDQVPEVHGILYAQAAPGYAPPPMPPPPAPGHGAPPSQASQVMQPNALADEIDRLYSSTVTFFVLYFIALVITVILAILFFSENEEEAGAIVCIVGGLATLAFLIVYIISFCKLHYRHWTVAIERTGFSDHTPGQAVGFLFIPLFNIYWMFPSYQKLAELLQRILAEDKYEGRGPVVNPGTSTAMCVLNIVSIIPYIGYLVSLVNIFIWFNVYNMNRKAVTYILRAGI